ncbi:unnamed protein product [Diatraea saccharalis]|uniref:Uncharacterized protein n=1 Tax=Diatraea saccharalis TaxID=40085 RepID=A0A9N9WKS3_9NEOP|nr:unnamed protein product [Diatraea saccharalis]
MYIFQGLHKALINIHKMAQGARRALLATLMVTVVVVPHFTAQPPSVDKSIEKDRTNRQSAIKAGRQVATTPKWGFFGTIFHLILEQINDTKSAYNQINEEVNSRFSNDNSLKKMPQAATNGSTEAPKLSRTEFLKVLDRNLKGLARLRNLEWREAKKDTLTNLRGYKDEIFRGKNNAKTK